MMSRHAVATVIFAAVSTVAAFTPAAEAGSARPAASVAQSGLPSAVPSTATPNVNDGSVEAVAKVGSTVVLGGSFTNASPPGDKGGVKAVARSGLLAFDASTGQLSTAFAPSLDGPVYALAAGPVAGTVFVGGQFKTVDGSARHGLALLYLRNGQLVPGFSNPRLDGPVWGLKVTGGRLFISGTFTVAGGLQRDGLASLDPGTAVVDGYLTVQLTGHHNYNGQPGYADGAVGAHRMDVSADGTRLVAEGNFTSADGLARNQLVMIDLAASAATVDPNWATLAFSASCSALAFDSYTRDVAFSPDGASFVVATTGGKTTPNVDGTHSLCDSVSRFETGASGADIAPTWADYSGQDSFESVADSGAAIYAGGHERWLNNPSAANAAGPGAVPRPGIVALDPATGLPFAWNPGRNPRGSGAYAVLPTGSGLYVGSDTDYVGNHQYYRGEIAYFPLAGGETPPVVAQVQLPASVFLAGPLAASSGAPASLDERSFDGGAPGPTFVVPGASGVNFASTHGAFLINSTLYWGGADGNLYDASFQGGQLGTPSEVQPWNDPAWATVPDGTGGTYLGKAPDFNGTELQQVTGMVYANGRLYYTRAGWKGLLSRAFEPDDGIVGEARTVFSGNSVDFTHVAGMVLVGATLYYADSTTGDLHAIAFDGGAPDPSTDHVVSGPGSDGNDWRAHGLFATSS